MDQHFFTIEFLLPKPIICIVEKQETRRDSECCSLFFLSGIFSVTKRAIKEESRERKLRRHKDDKLSQLHPPQLRALCNTSLPESEMADSPCKIHQTIQILFSHFFYSKAEAIYVCEGRNRVQRPYSKEPCATEWRGRSGSGSGTMMMSVDESDGGEWRSVVEEIHGWSFNGGDCWIVEASQW